MKKGLFWVSVEAWYQLLRRQVGQEDTLLSRVRFWEANGLAPFAWEDRDKSIWF